MALIADVLGEARPCEPESGATGFPRGRFRLLGLDVLRREGLLAGLVEVSLSQEAELPEHRIVGRHEELEAIADKARRADGVPTGLFHDAGPLRAGDLPSVLFTEGRPELGVEVGQRLREPSGQLGAGLRPAFRRTAPRGAVLGGCEHREPCLHHAQVEERQLLIVAHFQLGQVGQGLTLEVFSQSLLCVSPEVLG